MNDKTQRLNELEENLNYVCCLEQFIKKELGAPAFNTLLENSDYRSLVNIQLRLFGEIKSIFKEAGGDPRINNR